MELSIIVPFLNEEHYIERCINSLLNQDFDKHEYELIFIDNGSTDKSLNIARKFPEIIILQENRDNVYAARNKGIGIAKGQIIAFTDADCMVSRNWLSQIRKGMKNPDTEIALGKRCFPLNSTISLKMLEDYENAKINYVLTKCTKRYLFGFTNNMAVKAEVFKRIGPFIEWNVTGDLEFLLRYAVHSPVSNVAYLNSMKITHLEITNFKMWLKKIRIYGEHCSLVEKMRNYSRLDYKTKLNIYHYCVKKNNYRFLQTIYLFFLLTIGDLFYKSGIIKNFLKGK